MKISLNGEVFDFKESEIVCNIIQERLKGHDYQISGNEIMNEIFYISDFNDMMNTTGVDMETYLNFNDYLLI